MTNNKPNDVRVVPVELLERIVNLNNSFSDHRQAQHDLVKFLAQPADQQGEPVAIVVEETHNYGQYLVFGEGLRGARSPRPVVERKAHLLDQTLPTGTKLYAQPATAKVVLPERTTDTQSCSDVAKRIGLYGSVNVWQLGEIWNACLDEVAKLNGGQS